MYIDCSVVICAGAATEVESLRKALGEAEEKAVQQRPHVRSSRPGSKKSSRSSRMR